MSSLTANDSSRYFGRGDIGGKWYLGPDIQCSRHAQKSMREQSTTNMQSKAFYDVGDWASVLQRGC